MTRIQAIIEALKSRDKEEPGTQFIIDHITKSEDNLFDFLAVMTLICLIDVDVLTQLATQVFIFEANLKEKHERERSER